VSDRAEHQAADDVDDEDEDAGDGIALHELGGAVHRAVEIGFGGDFLAARLGFVRRQQPGIEVRVDRHLLAGHGIQGEAGGHFRDAAGALGDHDEVDDHQDREDEDADGIIAADQEIAKCLDDVAGGVRSLMSAHQNDACGCDVQRQPHQCREQQNGREG
jgi:hypothetical protein